NVINASEASGNVIITGVLKNVPADATNTVVTVVINGQTYTATCKGMLILYNAHPSAVMQIRTC
uniref:hypothetical protein n=1 Tax=Acinetobacter oleivorans TaxID=1148157 RepID=UPI001CF07EDB